MQRFFIIALMFVTASWTSSHAQDDSDQPKELDLIKKYVGVWDAEIEVWPQGTDAPSIKFKGVETNRAFGKHWISSDFESTFMSQTIKVHSIIGYDLDKKKMVGTTVDHGPYAAKMTGELDIKTKTVTWVTKVKDLNGKLVTQHTTDKLTSDTKRVVVLKVPAENEKDFKKFMRIEYTKRK